MSIILEYTDEMSTSFTEEFFSTVAKRVFSHPTFSFLSEKEITFGATLVSSEKIRSLNKEYRKNDAVTDVLSFGEYEGRTALTHIAEDQIFLGDIFLCFDFIAHSAEEDGVTLEREMVYIFSHGILHLLGFDHEEEMFTIQEMITDELTGSKK